MPMVPPFIPEAQTPRSLRIDGVSPDENVIRSEFQDFHVGVRPSITLPL
jgi:hypothetical protein